MTNWCVRLVILSVLAWPLAGLGFAAEEDSALARGRQIYADSCAVCHGEAGQGVEGSYDHPLTGDESLGQLASRIASTMPEGEPEVCIGEDAQAVAEFIHSSFYSEAAQLRNRPPQIGLARLTANQLRQSYADLYEQFGGSLRNHAEAGVRGTYFDGQRWRKENIKIERVDQAINFDFGKSGPGSEIKPESFYIYWEGGLKVETSGRYEIVVNSTCSFKLDFGRNGRLLIDNHTQSGDKIEFRRRLQLTAGRVYPFKIEFVQRERKTEQPPARIRLAWVPPGGQEEVIPTRNLVATSAPPTFALQSELPPDDRSYGFERGIAVNRQWDDATTAAAIEFAQVAAEELWPDYLRRQRKQDVGDREKLELFLTEIIQAAFRSSLSQDLVDTYIRKQLAAEPNDLEAIKRVLLVSLKSPRFLYPQADFGNSVSQRVANRLALILFDSLPVDKGLKEAVAANRLVDESQVRRYVETAIKDYRVQAKMLDMLHQWLNIEHFGDLRKDSDRFPGFDAHLISDLRTSLDAFLYEVVWGESSDYRQFFGSRSRYTTPRIAEFYAQNTTSSENLWKVSEAEQVKAAAEEDSDATAPAAQSEFVGVERVESEEADLGLLSHPYVLSGLAYFDATSPIHRGVFLMRYMLGRTLRPPAEAFSPLSPDLHPDLTTRQRVELQTSPESCQVCHVKINGLGFALENYDAVGRWRRAEVRAGSEKPIDAEGSYTDRQGNTIEFHGAQDLANYMARSEDAQRAFVSRAFQHFVKQPPAAFGAETLDNLTLGFRKSNCNVRQLIVEIAVLAARKPVVDSETLAQNQ